MLKRAHELLHNACTIVSSVLDGEEDAMDGVPENMRGSERYEKIEAAVDLLSDAIICIDSSIEKIEEAVV